MNTSFARGKKALIAAGLTVMLAAGATGAYAWGGDKHGTRDPGQRFEYIFTQLNLTEEQSQQVIDVMKTFAESQREAMQERREAGGERPTQEEFEAMREAAHQQLADQLGTVLQPSQVEELITYMEFHGKGMRGGPGGHHHRGGDRQAPNAPAETPEASE